MTTSEFSHTASMPHTRRPNWTFIKTLSTLLEKNYCLSVTLFHDFSNSVQALITKEFHFKRQTRDPDYNFSLFWLTCFVWLFVCLFVCPWIISRCIIVYNINFVYIDNFKGIFNKMNNLSSFVFFCLINFIEGKIILWSAVLQPDL